MKVVAVTKIYVQAADLQLEATAPFKGLLFEPDPNRAIMRPW